MGSGQPTEVRINDRFYLAADLLHHAADPLGDMKQTCAGGIGKPADD